MFTFIEANEAVYPASVAAPTAKLPFFLRKKLGCWSLASVPYDDVIKLRMREPAWLLTDPVAIQYVLESNAANYVEIPATARARWLPRADGSPWTHGDTSGRVPHHDTLSEFTTAILPADVDLILTRTAAMVAAWPLGTAINVGQAAQQLARSIMIGLLFGHVARGYEAHLLRTLERRQKCQEAIYRAPMLWRIRRSWRALHNYRLTTQTLDMIIYAAVKARRTAPQQFNDLTARLMPVHICGWHAAE